MVEDLPTGYKSDKVTGSSAHSGSGLYAVSPIDAGDVLVVWGGQVVPSAVFEEVAPERRKISLQIEEHLFLVPTNPGPSDRVNHSCSPNAGMRGQITLVAMRDIEPGEEICFDYAMSDGCAYDEFDCACGARDCRGRVSGDDWRNPLLWERYEGYFIPYLAERIRRLRARRAPDTKSVVALKAVDPAE